MKKTKGNCQLYKDEDFFPLGFLFPALLPEAKIVPDTQQSMWDVEWMSEWMNRHNPHRNGQMGRQSEPPSTSRGPVRRSELRDVGSGSPFLVNSCGTSCPDWLLALTAYGNHPGISLSLSLFFPFYWSTNDIIGRFFIINNHSICTFLSLSHQEKRAQTK